MALSRAHLIISGRVQGVFYRSFAEETALSLGLKGWVRNLPDGRVEAVFEGERQDIEKAISLCQKGPPVSKVSDISVKWEEFQAEFRGFSIRYF
ncbi:MAG: acylphosphatase [Nitrospirae bacterium]|nr:acylphosphatase [Nitrospirota bacterium]